MGTARPLFQACICVERYLAVLHPVLFLKYKPLRYRVACSTVAWLSNLGLCLVPAFNPHTLPVVWCYVGLPLSLVMFSCCVAMLRALKQSGPGGGAGGKKGASQAKVKAFRFITVILVIMVISYSPLVALRGLDISFSEDQRNVAHSIFVLSMMTMGST